MKAGSDKEGFQRPAAHRRKVFGPNMFPYKMELNVCRWDMLSPAPQSPQPLSLIPLACLSPVDIGLLTLFYCCRHWTSHSLFIAVENDRYLQVV